MKRLSGNLRASLVMLAVRARPVTAETACRADPYGADTHPERPMKTLALALALSLAPLAPSAPKPVNYSGSWTLDKARSKGLPSFYDRVRSQRLEIAQRGWHLDVGVVVDIGEAAADTMRFVYTINGAETRTVTAVRGPGGMMQVPTVLRAVASADRQVHLTIERDIALGQGSFHAVSKEDWQLGADGNTLTVHRADDTPRGPMQSEMVFTRSGH